MNIMKRAKEFGFTLVEMLLVLAIVGIMIGLSIGYVNQRTRALNIDRASLQMQQILNAGMAYYVNNSQWPADIATLQQAGYLPVTAVAGQIPSPWGTNYVAAPNAANPGNVPPIPAGIVFQVSMSFPANMANSAAFAQILAGKLPLGTVNTTVTPPPPPPPVIPPSSTTTVTASVNIPGQSLSNLGNVNFAGIYHNGACVPAPACPAVTGSGASLTPQIMVVPVSASGMSDANSTNVYPISSFTAKAIGNAGGTGPMAIVGGVGPAACLNELSSTAGAPDTNCYADQTNPGTLTPGGAHTGQIMSGNYWRVCLYIVTEHGDVTYDTTSGAYASVMAITRCGINTENKGSSFNVWSY